MWIVDLGASTHMCHDFTLFQNISKINSPSFVTLLDGTIKQVLHKGTIKINPKLHLHNTLHTPNFKCNLMSVSAFTKVTNIAVSFFADHCILLDPVIKEVVTSGELQGGLYIISSKSFENKCSSKASHIRCTKPMLQINEVYQSSSNSYELWHYRLGHMSNTKLSHISATSPKKKYHEVVCEVCPLAKQ